MKKIIALLCATVVLAGCATPKKEQTKAPRNIGIAMYTFHKRTLEEMAPFMKDLGIKYIGLSRTPFSPKYPKVKTGHAMNAEQRAYLKKIVKDYGFELKSYGVVTPKTEADLKEMCEFAKEMSIPLILTEATGDMLKLCQQYGEKYNIDFAIHCHAVEPNKKWYELYKPEYVKNLIAPYSRVYSCPDTGAWLLSGYDATAGLKTLEGTVKMIHLKDSNKFNDYKGNSVPFGTGIGNLKKFLVEFDRQKLGEKGVCLMIEYEVNADCNDEDVKKCVNFLRNN